MKRKKLSDQFQNLLKSAKRLADLESAAAVVVLPEQNYNFKNMNKLLRGARLLIATDDEAIQESVRTDEIGLIPLEHEPQSPVNQVSQVLLEAIADELLQSGDSVVVLYSSFEKESCDTISLIHLSEQLAKLTSRDLQKLETQVPLETLRVVVDLACEIGREGREGKSVGTLFVVGHHRKVMELSTEQIHDPFRGYNKAERLIRSPRTRESMKELAQIDGAFIISADGVVQAAGRHLRATAEEIFISKGLGSRHWAAAEISKATDAIAIAVSESTGTVRVFQDGKVVLRIEPMDANMKFIEPEEEPETP